MSNVTPIGSKPDEMEKANDYLLDASDFAAVLRVFLNSDNHEFARGRGATLAKEIDRLIEAAREIVVDARPPL